VMEHRERERSWLRQTTINSYDIVLRVIERGFIRGTLTIENVPRITRGGTKGGDGSKEEEWKEGRQIEKIHEDGRLYGIIFTCVHCCIQRSGSC